MANTPQLAIVPPIVGQALAEVTVADALHSLDAFAMPAVINRTTTTPPGSPADGDRYLLPASGTLGGVWLAHNNHVALYRNGWIFFPPKDGWQLWCVAEKRWLRYNTSAAWIVSSILKTISIYNPVNSENLTILYTNVPITIRSLSAVVRGTGSPSVTWTIRYMTDRTATGTEVITSGTATTATTTITPITSFSSANIPAGNFVVLKTTAIGGTTQTELSITIEYSED